MGHTPMSKRARFVIAAERRTNNAITLIRQIGKLANKQAYEYGDKDVTKIIDALSIEVEAMQQKMLSGSPFTLHDGER